MRKIICYIATSADGYIAGPNGEIDWLNKFDDDGGFGMMEFYNSIDTIIWGRKTYDFMIEVGEKFDGNVRNYIFSRKPPENPAENTVFVTASIKDFCSELLSRDGKDIWMMGGAAIIREFLKVGYIDEFIIHRMPVFIGEGVPLIAPATMRLDLDLMSMKSYDNGVIRVHYAVRHAN